jgi:tetratricopeptide (TPR) repeat protein
MAHAALREHERLAVNTSTPDEASIPWLTRAQEAIERYHAAPVVEGDPIASFDAQIGRLTLRAAQSWLSLDPPRADRARAMLTQMDAAQTTKAEEQAWRLALEGEAVALSPQGTGAKAWLDRVLHPGSGATLCVANDQALTLLTDRLEWQLARPVTGRTTEETHGVLAWLVEVYGYLLEKDDLPSGIAMRRRLAHALFRLRRYQAAIREHDRLLESAANQQSAGVLREMALSYEGLGQWDRALERWRTLDRGLSEASEGWFEAKYHVVTCYDRLGERPHAIKLLEYLRLRHPTIAFDHWQQTFSQLADQWGAPNE